MKKSKLNSQMFTIRKPGPRIIEHQHKSEIAINCDVPVRS